MKPKQAFRYQSCNDSGADAGDAVLLLSVFSSDCLVQGGTGGLLKSVVSVWHSVQQDMNRYLKPQGI